MTPRELMYRIAGFVTRRRRQQDLDDQLRFHREMLEQDLRRQGMTAEQAAREARLRIGGASQVAEVYADQRSLPWIETFARDLRFGARMLVRAPGFTLAALFTLTLGIGANTAIFSIVDAVLLRPLPYFEPERLVTVGDRTPDGTSSNVDFTTLTDWRGRSRSFEALVLMRSWQPTLVAGGEAERLPAVRVSWNYFDMMGVRPALGRTFTADDDRPEHWRVLMLSDALWRRRFGADPAVVGRTVVMNDRQYRVIGVMPVSFEPLDAGRYYTPPQLWAPVGYDVSMQDACRGCQHLRAFGRLKRGITITDATAEMNTIREQMRREYPNEYDAGSIAIVPLADALTGPFRTALQVLLIAVGFVLLIACANVANLLFARSLTRQRELTLRAVLGAGRGRIVRQLLTESALLSGCGAVGGIGLAMLTVRGLAAFAPVSLPRLDHVGVDGRVLVFAVMTALATTIVFGLVPAWRAARTGVQTTLAIDSRGSVGGASRTRSALVVLDLALALVLLAGAGLMLRTVLALTHTHPGFESARTLTLQFSLVGKAYAEDSAVVAFQDRFLQKTRALPGIETVALAGQIPFGGNRDCWGFHAQGRMKPNPVEDPCIERYGSTPEYLRTMGIPLRRGRFFNETDVASSQPVIVISESTARMIWGADNPLGAQVRIGAADRGPWRTVIGVVADGHHQDLTAAPTAAMHTPQTQLTDSFLVAIVKSATTDPAKLAAPVREVLRELDPSVPVYDLATLDSLVAKASGQRVFVMRLLGGFAALALLLAAIGLYGVVSYGVSQRTREVGVRVALGAQPTDILRLIMSHGFVLVGAGIAVGLVAAFVATRYLGALVFGVSPADVLTFTAATAILMAVALAAHWVPIARALRIDPAVALRQE